MRIELITMWFNEEFLAPFFLKHYSYADRINILYDTDTTDNTKSICEQYPNVRLLPFKFPNMMDDEIKRDIINNLYHTLDADWILSVDSDEFAFIKEHDFFIYDFHNFLAADTKHDVYNVMLHQVYRHVTDKDLDPALPAVPQRRHGDPNITTGINAMYRKPVLVRGKLPLKWGPGCHAITRSAKALSVAPTDVLGAHWAMADPQFAMERRLKNRKARQSQNNLNKQLTVHQHTITAKELTEDFKRHMNDPQLF